MDDIFLSLQSEVNKTFSDLITSLNNFVSSVYTEHNQDKQLLQQLFRVCDQKQTSFDVVMLQLDKFNACQHCKEVIYRLLNITINNQLIQQIHQTEVDKNFDLNKQFDSNKKQIVLLDKQLADLNNQLQRDEQGRQQHRDITMNMFYNLADQGNIEQRRNELQSMTDRLARVVQQVQQLETK